MNAEDSRPPLGVPPGLRLIGRRRRTWRKFALLKFMKYTTCFNNVLLKCILKLYYLFGDLDFTGLVSFIKDEVFLNLTDRRASRDIRGIASLDVEDTFNFWSTKKMLVTLYLFFQNLLSLPFLIAELKEFFLT